MIICPTIGVKAAFTSKIMQVTDGGTTSVLQKQSQYEFYNEHRICNDMTMAKPYL